MTVRLIEGASRGVPVGDMRDGQLAQIVGWTTDRPVGRLVQRYGKALVVIGADSDDSYGAVFDSRGVHPLCRVEILPDGSYALEVFDNE